jgi:hypothetical protein
MYYVSGRNIATNELMKRTNENDLFQQRTRNEIFLPKGVQMKFTNSQLICQKKLGDKFPALIVPCRLVLTRGVRDSHR